MSRSQAAASALPLILGAALAGIAFGAQGGTELTRTTIVEVLLVVAGTALIVAALIRGREGPLYGGTALLLFAVFAVFTGLSLLWSIVPELSYIEAGRTFAYLIVFTAAIAGARLAPRAAPGVLQGLLLAAAVIAAYALASRVWPAALAENEVSNRLGAPFDYWNAVGTVAAMAVPVALWLGSRRTGGAVLRALAYPAMGAFVVAILLTQSRAAAAAAAIGAVAWFAIVPLRIRSLPVLAFPLAAGSAVAAWALSKDPFSKTAQPLAAKEAVAGDFGLLVLLMAVLLLLVGFAVNVGMERRELSGRMRRRIGIAAVAVACLVPLAGFTSVAFSERGIGDRIDELTSETQVSPEEGGGRVFAASSSRGKYWREAGRVFGDRPAAGVGAGAFAVGRLRHRTDSSVSRHAHGWVVQTLADLGLIGVVITTLLLLAWIAAALVATNLVPSRLARLRGSEEAPPPRRDWDGDRIALVALALVPLVFGIQSLLDWTWFIPAPASMALIAAGFVAGRGPLPPVAEERLAGEGPARQGMGMHGLLPAIGVVLVALLICWAIWQPEASDRATNDALALSDERKFDAAIARTEDAEHLNPLTPDPLLVRASIDTTAGREEDAERSLERAVLSFPGDPQTWYRLAAFQLGTLDQPDQALETLRGALYLDPHSQATRQLFLDARARKRELDASAQPAATAQPAPSEQPPPGELRAPDEQPQPKQPAP